MNKRAKNTWIIILTLTIGMLIYGCSKEKNTLENINKEVNNETVIIEEKKVFDKNIDNLSAWITYWDLDVQGEVRSLDKNLKDISYFAAYFDSNNELLVPQQLVDYYSGSKDEDYTKYLTIVNDKINSSGSSSLKDTDLLRTLLADSNSRNQHAKEIIDLVSLYGFDGIEIDYEQIKDDIGVWNNYLLFIKELYDECDGIGLKLRVILEPNIPFEDLEFIEGPTYVMMCYNLHGGFSEPGEKANPKFIKDLMDKMESIPGSKNFAVATGGFNWASDGEVTSLSEMEAKDLVKEYKAKEERDNESQCILFKYTDDDGIEHEVWYADKNTLNSWMQVIKEKGYGISLWRLGGNMFH